MSVERLFWVSFSFGTFLFDKKKKSTIALGTPVEQFSEHMYKKESLAEISPYGKGKLKQTIINKYNT